MDMVFTSGPMEVFTKATGTRIKYRGMASTIGMMAGLTKDIGSKIICMAKVFILGPTAESMRVNT